MCYEHVIFQSVHWQLVALGINIKYASFLTTVVAYGINKFTLLQYVLMFGSLSCLVVNLLTRVLHHLIISYSELYPRG